MELPSFPKCQKCEVGGVDSLVRLRTGRGLGSFQGLGVHES